MTKLYSVTNSKFEIFPYKNGYKALVYDKNLCRRMNKLLKIYPDDVVFHEGDEATFQFTKGMLDNVKIALKIKG